MYNHTYLLPLTVFPKLGERLVSVPCEPPSEEAKPGGGCDTVSEAWGAGAAA